MKKQSSQTLLILFSIVGFILIASGVSLTLLYDQIYYLALVGVGIIISIISLSLSSRKPFKEKAVQPKYSKTEPNEVYEDYLELAPINRQTKETDEPEEIVPPVIEGVKPEPIPSEPDPFTIELDIDTKTSEALLRLTEKMIDHQLIIYNPTYEEENTSTSDIFKEAFKAIPVVGVVKNRFNNYNILAGITHDDVEIIGTIKEENLELVKEIHPKTQNIRAIITGGKFKSPSNTEHTQAHRVEVTFYV